MSSHLQRCPMLVTGASGLLGANFCLQARDEYQVFACSLQHSLQMEQVTARQLDLRAPASIVRLLDEIKPQVIVHFAAATDVNRCEAHQAEADILNVHATEHLAAWTARAGARFLLMSTDGLFDGERGGYTEMDAPGPVNHYAVTKLLAEQAVVRLVPDHLIIRGSIYGWNAQPKLSLAEWVLKKLEAGERVPGFADVVFAPLLVNTLSTFLLTLLRQERRGFYHAASRDALSKHAFARTIAEEFSLPVDLVDRTHLSDAPQLARRPRNTSLDARKLAAETGLVLPAVRDDIRRFRALRAAGLDRQLKAACANFPHE